MKEPQPEEQASLSCTESTVWFFILMHFISWPPMSRNTVDFRIEECGSVIMGNRLYLTLVQHQCSFDERLAVTGGAGKSNFCIFRKKAVNLLDGVCMVVFSGFPLLLL